MYIMRNHHLHTTLIIDGDTITNRFSSREMRFKRKFLIHQNTMSVWKKFKERYRHADLSRFTQTDLYGDNDDAIYFNSKESQLI